MEIKNFNGFQNVQVPSCYQDLTQLQQGLVLGGFEDFTMNVPLVYTNTLGPERLLMKYRNNRILRARLDEKDGSSIDFQEGFLMAKGFSLSPFTQNTCEQSRWIIDHGIINQALPEIKQKNRMI